MGDFHLRNHVNHGSIHALAKLWLINIEKWQKGVEGLNSSGEADASWLKTMLCRCLADELPD